MSSNGHRHHEPDDADPYLPAHGDASYDVTHYDLALEYRLEGNHLSGRARIDAIARETLRSLSVDLEGLRATKVSVAGDQARYSHHRGRLTIRPRTAIKAGRQFAIAITYDGRPRPVSSRAGEAGWEELADGVIVAGQPCGAPSWFPCNDRPSSKATYRIEISAPSDYHVVANGELVEQRRRASLTTWTYEQPAPMAPYLATVQIGRYEVHPLADDPVPMRAVAPRELSHRLSSAFGRQGDMMRAFTQAFGPYPFDSYAVVVTADDLEIPLEAQGLSIFGANFLSDTWENTRLVAHELAHQWFGNSLTVAAWRDIWLHEGFACYAEWLWSEQSGGRSAHELAVEHHRHLGRERQDLRIGDPGPARMFDDRVYKRGALTLHEIRRRVGDRAFFDLLPAWTDAHRHGSVSTDGFASFASSRTGHDLGPLLDDWLNQRRLPALADSPAEAPRG